MKYVSGGAHIAIRDAGPLDTRGQRQVRPLLVFFSRGGFFMRVTYADLRPVIDDVERPALDFRTSVKT
jgi:hypothetical protein